MKKNDLKKLALAGLCSGMMISQPCYGEATDAAPISLNQTYTEEELLLELNDETKQLYQSLTPEGKALAIKVASQICKSYNDCKGLNACKTDKNACAGQGDCKGLSKCAFIDKNLAVQVVAKKMAEKRRALTQ